MLCLYPSRTATLPLLRRLEAMLQKDGESAAALLAANDELADMRERLDNNDLEKENKIYDLQRTINISSQTSKEHVNALSIAAKKLVKFEDRTKVCDRGPKSDLLGQTLIESRGLPQHTCTYTYVHLPRLRH